MVQREETAVQAEAFEAYYAMGDNRSLVELRQHWGSAGVNRKNPPVKSTIENWSRWFHWQERIVIRDKAIAEGVEKKTTKAAIDRKAKWLSQAEDRIKTAFEEDGRPKFGVEDNKSLNEIVKLALVLMGEPERKEVSHQHEIKIIEVKESKRDD